MYKPHCESERADFSQSNPISRNLSNLAQNLTHLNYYSSDPVSGECGDMNHDGGQLFGQLMASYYTMGAFELRTILFENTCQALYEARMLEEEFANWFWDDHNGSVNPTEFSSSMWSYSSQAPDIGPQLELKGTKDSDQLIDQIFQRISAIAKSIETSPQTQDRGLGEQRTRNWAVAPKLFPENSSLHQSFEATGTSISGQHTGQTVVCDKRVWQASSSCPPNIHRFKSI